MQLCCPHCGYQKEVDPRQIPEGTSRATCPRCQGVFPLTPESPAHSNETTAGKAAASTASQPADAGQTAVASFGGQSMPLTAAEQAARQPKAGFWVRVVATLIDSASDGGALALLVELFGYAIGLAYYIVFTGHGGQTPGKMVLGVKVIRTDGSDIGYGRAAYREVLCKFVSGIILCIGYLMVAFDLQKQGLHDRMADTYVIKK